MYVRYGGIMVLFLRQCLVTLNDTFLTTASILKNKTKRWLQENIVIDMWIRKELKTMNVQFVITYFLNPQFINAAMVTFIARPVQFVETTLLALVDLAKEPPQLWNNSLTKCQKASSFIRHDFGLK